MEKEKANRSSSCTSLTVESHVREYLTRENVTKVHCVKHTSERGAHTERKAGAIARCR